VTSLLQQSIRIAVGITWVIALLVLSLTTIWAAAALYFDLPASVAPGVLVAIFYVIAVVALLFSFRFSWVALGIGFALFAGIAFWWCSIKPPKSGNWQPQVAETAWTERDGDKITIHNLRNFGYQPGQPPKVRWETRVVDLSQLQGVDLFINFWGSTLICHPIISF
jgi:ABC-type transport system involved in multi-copper enzyme maturation permease subunit